ncbi:MAG TPA: GFA family protein [Roseiarcus sp.]|nr:GFA family protein [Roseiarcus sp.]
MRVDGRCHCGEIAYSAEGDPEHVAICYCTDCQRLGGSTFRISLTVPAASFVLRSGKPKTYVKTAESGARRVQAFCGNCGSPVYSAAEIDPPAYTLRVGCLEQRAELSPKRQIWLRSKPAWIEPPAAVPQFEKDGRR